MERKGKAWERGKKRGKRRKRGKGRGKGCAMAVRGMDAPGVC